MRKTAASSALLIAALGITAGAAGAAPEHSAQPVNYTATVTKTETATATAISTDTGSLAVDEGVFKIKAGDGTVLAGAELSFRVDDFIFPIAADIKGRSATLAPVFDLAHAQYRPVALPFEDQSP